MTSAKRKPSKKSKPRKKGTAYEKHEKIQRGAIGKPGTSEVTRTGDWRNFYPEFDMDQCSRCGKCLESCPDAAIHERELSGREAREALKRAEELEKAGKSKKAAAKKAHIQYELDPTYCKGCGICANECPVQGIKMKMEEK
ncbi:MAG: 4Fe-4S binding protein [Euryarchaeota archaeon]